MVKATLCKNHDVQYRCLDEELTGEVFRSAYGSSCRFSSK